MCDANCITRIYLFYLAMQDKGKRDFAILNACLFLRAQKTRLLPVCVGEGMSCKPRDFIRDCTLGSLYSKFFFFCRGSALHVWLLCFTRA